MVKSDSESKEVPEKGITQAQMSLIGELYEETGFKQQYCAEELAQISRDTANKHIQLLLETKSRDYQLRKHNETGVVFDKIGFGMVYKLCWRTVHDEKAQVPLQHYNFERWVIDEYKMFKEVQEDCRQFVKDGGLK